MNKMQTLGSVANRVEMMSQNCHDEMIGIPDITFDSIETVQICGTPYPLLPIAQRSIAYRLRIPYDYLSRCPKVLQQVNLDYWIDTERNNELLFRFKGDAVRAIFTPKYIPVDNFEVLEKLSGMGYGPEKKVQCHLDDNFMSLNIPDGNQSFSINGSGEIVPGISIANSEVGLSALKLSAYFLRLVCLNGMVVKEENNASYKHISRRVINEFESVVNNVSQNLAQQRSQFEISLHSSVNNPKDTFESFNKQYMLSEKEREAVTWGHEQEPGNTMFDVVNAYTRGAQHDGLTAESRHKLQVVGGNIMASLN